MANKPVAEWKSEVSSLRLSAWKNDKGFSFSFNKRYKDKETGEWKDSKYLYDNDLRAAQEIIQQALDYVAQKDSEASLSPAAAAANISFVDDDIPF